jgi:hypothetical protein
MAVLLAWQVRPASASSSEVNKTTHVHIAGRRRVAVSSGSARSTPPPGSGPTIYNSQQQSMLYYRTMELFALPTYGKVLAVIAVAMPVLLLGSALYKRAIGCSWGEALTTSYSVLNNCPGKLASRPTSCRSGCWSCREGHTHMHGSHDCTM